MNVLIFVDILLQFVASNVEEYQLKALLSLKDYLFLNYKTLVKDIGHLMNAFIIGSISENKLIQLVSANAISFMVTHGIAYKDKQDSLDAVSSLQSPSYSQRSIRLSHWVNPEVNGILDAIMHLSSSEYQEIRSTAFSSLSALSDLSSTNKFVMG